MDLRSSYDKAAVTWRQKLVRLGYIKAYTGFLAHSALETGAVLDVGTGTGAFAVSWIEVGGSPDMTLLDPSSAMLDQASLQFRRLGLRPNVINSGLEDLPKDVQFDAILASHVLEHFADPMAAMGLLSQRLVSGGWLYLIVSKPHWCNWVIWVKFRHRWFQAETVQRMARNAGLTTKRLHVFRQGPPSRTSLGYIFLKP